MMRALTGVLVLVYVVGNGMADTENQPWVLATADTRIEIAARDGQVAIRRLEAPQAPHNWAGGEMTVPLMARVWANEREVAPVWTLSRAVEDRNAGTVTLDFTCAAPALALRSIWRARPGRGPVEHWIEIENRSKQRVTLGHQDSLTLGGLTVGDAADIWWIKRGGGNASTQGGVVTQPLTGKVDLKLASNCRDGASPVPWLAVQVGQQRGLYVGWEFSGPGRVSATGGPNGLNLDVGLHPDFRTDVEPGETFLVPPAFVGCYVGDIDDGSYSLHRFVLEKLRPPLAGDYADPTLAYNLYLDAGGSAATEADVLKCAAICRELGFETFVPDAMWFPQTGDWTWDPRRFPNGSEPIEQYVHGQGMQLGLWCAWTNGGLWDDEGALNIRRNPDWFADDFGPDWRPGAFTGGLLCLGSADAAEWAAQKTQALVAQHRLDYLKVDIDPIVVQCNKATHRHQHGVDTGYWAALGYYRVQDELRKAFPKLVLENCSGGGHIKDFGVVQRTHYTVTTDTLSNLPDRQSIYDSTFALPPLLLQAYTYDNSYPVKGDEPAPFLWRSAMMSAWQIDPTDALKWNEEQKLAARRAVEIYKTWIRPLLRDVQVHHILPRPDGVRWDGLFYWSAPLKRGTLYIFRPDVEAVEQTVRLKGLDPAAGYWVWCEDGSINPGVRSGAQLMNDGLSVRLPRRYASDLIYVQDAALGKPAGLAAAEPVRLMPAKSKADAFSPAVKLTWTASASARSYRVLVTRGSGSDEALRDEGVLGTSVTLEGLPPRQSLHWRVETIAWGGRCWNEGGDEVFVAPAPSDLTGLTFVSDMEWKLATAGGDKPVRRDQNYHGKPVQIADQLCRKAVWTHAFNDAQPADVVLDVAGKGFAAFAADAGLDDASGGGNVQFQVLADGQVRAESPVLRPRVVHRFRVDITGAREVTLRVLNGGDGSTCDHAVWGLARFIAAGADDPLAQTR